MNRSLADMLDRCPSAFQAAQYVRARLKEAGFTELKESDSWQLEHGGRYFMVRNESAVMAFMIPEGDFHGYMISGAHIDSPAWKIKENPEMVANGYVRLNVEGYGGMLMNPWFDRPLGICGRLIVMRDGKFETIPVHIDKDLAVIPSLAIHMNRGVNKGVEINPQADMLPVWSDDSGKGTFMKTIAGLCGVKEEEILGHDLYLYVREKARIWGKDDEYISGPHLDDLQSSFGTLEGFLAAKPEKAVAVCGLFDNEEVGSLSKQGARSTILSDLLARISACFGKDGTLIANSFMISADNSHALHPNHPEKADPINRLKMNGGIVLKYASNTKYATDGVSAAVFRHICAKAGVPVQVFTNRSDSAGGSTLGNLCNEHVSLNMADIGLAQLAMHSCYETAGTRDTEYLVKAMKLFFSSSLTDLGQGRYAIELPEEAM